jgi:hypothetical protein
MERPIGKSWRLSNVANNTPSLARAYRERDATVAELEERIRTLEAERQWQPIDTAPKDGTVVILADVHSVWTGFWHNGKDNYWGFEGWYEEDQRANILTAKPSPATDWMPLPSPPGAARKGANEGKWRQY